MREDPFADHPFGDTAFIAGARFAVEVTAWVFGIWAAYRLASAPGAVAAAVVLLVAGTQVPRWWRLVRA